MKRLLCGCFIFSGLCAGGDFQRNPLIRQHAVRNLMSYFASESIVILLDSTPIKQSEIKTLLTHDQDLVDYLLFNTKKDALICDVASCDNDARIIALSVDGICRSCRCVEHKYY